MDYWQISFVDTVWNKYLFYAILCFQMRNLAQKHVPNNRCQQLPDMEDITESETYELPSHTVTVTDVTEVDFVGTSGLRLGINQVSLIQWRSYEVIGQVSSHSYAIILPQQLLKEPVWSSKSKCKDQTRFLVSIACPHSVVTHIGSVTRDQKIPGLNPMWVGCCGVDIYQWCLTGLTKGLVVTVHNCLWLRAPKRPLGVCQKEYGIVSRLRVSVCRRYVHNSDERRR